MLTKINIKISSLLIIVAIAIGSCNNSQDPTKTNVTTETLKTSQTTATKETTGMTASRLNTIKSRGKLICGVNGKLPGFSMVDEKGNYSGMDVDICRAIAAAIFDYPTKVEYRSLDTEERFPAVESGEVDLLSRNTTWTLSRDTSIGMEFAPTIFYDGQGLLVTKESEIEELEDLDGKSVCVLSGTTNQENLADHMRELGLNYAPIVFEDIDMMMVAYEEGRCEAATSDRSQLTTRHALLKEPDDHEVLEEIVLSKEPLSPVIIDGDAQWFDVVKWVVYTLIEAEELGINSQNVSSFTSSKNPEIRRFLGAEGNLGKDIGLTNDFTQRIIKHVGNYEEIYDRNIGDPFGLERGLNALWTDGGLLYAPPFR